jgi:type VI secretion system VasD/TssJ family lipoprotein
VKRRGKARQRTPGVLGFARGVLAVAWVVAVCLLGCRSNGEPAAVCVNIDASPNLNLFSGDPHVVVVYFYPLQNVMAFRQTDAVDLLDGKRPPGLMGDRFEITIFPGTQRQVSETLPRDTQFVGILADFYNGPSKAVVEAQCGMFGGPTVVLSSSDVQVK